MKNLALILILFGLTLACGKTSGSSDQNIRPFGNYFDFRRIQPSYIILDVNEAIEFQLDMIDVGDLAISFEYNCERECPPAIHIDQNGVFHWQPDLLPEDYRVPGTDFFTIEASDAWGYRKVMQFSLHIYDHSYRIGDSWNRFHLHESEFRSLPNQIQKFQYAIATQKQVDRPATSSITYLGEFAGLHLVATNRHVLSLLDGPRCSRERIFHFTTLGIETYCDSLLIEGDGIDYAILSISSDQENLSILKENSPILGLNSGHSIRTPLVLAGHGRYRNIYSELTFNISDDCQIFDEELRYFSNIGDVGMITCNASPGDSGGPVILRESGALIGIIRGGRYGASINSSSSLHEVLDLSIDEKLEYRHTHYLPLAVIKVDVESRLDQVEDLTHRQALRELFKLD